MERLTNRDNFLRYRRTRISTPTVNERTEAMTPLGFAWEFYEANK